MRTIHRGFLLSTLALVVAGCGDEPALWPPIPVLDVDVAEPRPEPVRVVPDETPPHVIVVSPLPGTPLVRHGGRAEVVVSVSDDVALADLTVGDETTSFAPWTSTASEILSPAVRQGLTTVDVVARDAAGNVTRSKVTLLAADRWREARSFPVRAAIDGTAFDAPSVHRALDGLVSGLRLRDHVPRYLGEGAGHKATLEGLEHGPPSLRLRPTDGGLSATVVIPDIGADIVVTGPIDNRTHVTAGLRIRLDLLAGVDGGRPRAAPLAARVELGRLDVLLPWPLSAMRRQLQGELETRAGLRLLGMADRVLREALPGLPHALRLPLLPRPGRTPFDPGAEAALDRASLSASGLEVEATVSWLDGRPVAVPAWSGCPAPARVTSPWRLRLPVGLLQGAVLRWHAAGALSAEVRDHGIGAVDGPIAVSLQHPPVLSPCGGPDGRPLLQVAGLRVAANVGAGPLKTRLEAELTFDLVLVTRRSADGRLSVAFEPVPGTLQASHPIVAQIARQVLPPLLAEPWFGLPLELPYGVTIVPDAMSVGQGEIVFGGRVR